MTVSQYFKQAREFERPIFDVVNTHFESLGDVIVDPIAMGIMFKNGPMVCELRAKTKWVAVGFNLNRRLSSGKLSRKVSDFGSKFFHVVNVATPDEVDEDLLEWLTEAYHFAGGTLDQINQRVDAMVPDDIDDPF